MVRAGRAARPKARAAELGMGHWENVSGQGTCQPVSSPAQPGLQTLKCPFEIPGPPLGRRTHSLTLVCPPVKWGDSGHPSYMEEPDTQQGRDDLVSSFPSEPGSQGLLRLAPDPPSCSSPTLPWPEPAASFFSSYPSSHSPTENVYLSQLGSAFLHWPHSHTHPPKPNSSATSPKEPSRMLPACPALSFPSARAGPTLSLELAPVSWASTKGVLETGEVCGGGEKESSPRHTHQPHKAGTGEREPPETANPRNPPPSPNHRLEGEAQSPTVLLMLT